MGVVDDIYRQACDDVARMPTPELDAEERRIWILIGTMCDAVWHRSAEPGFSLFHALVRNARNSCPESAMEVALWNELTSPQQLLGACPVRRTPPGERE